MFTSLKAMCFYVCSVKLCAFLPQVGQKNTTLICSTYLEQIFLSKKAVSDSISILL